MSAERLARIDTMCLEAIRHLLTHTSGIGYGMIDRDERFRMIYQKAGIIDLYTTEDVSIDPDCPVKGARKFFSGGAGLSSTAKDYATFLQMYLNGGELNVKRILSRTTVQFIMANQIGHLWGENAENYYGLAFGVINQRGQDMGGQGSAGTFYWGGYFNTQYFADPQEQLIGILMKQTEGRVPDNTGWRFRLLTGQAVDD